MGNKIESVMNGLSILARYSGAEVSANHDAIKAGPPGDVDVTPEDAEALELLGWHWDVVEECWEIFT